MVRYIRCNRHSIDHDAFQCGYCTPGQICSAAGLIAEGKAKTPNEIREFDERATSAAGAAYPEHRRGDPAGDGCIMINFQYTRAGQRCRRTRFGRFTADLHGENLSRAAPTCSILMKEGRRTAVASDRYLAAATHEGRRRPRAAACSSARWCRIPDLAWHPLIAERYPMLGSAILAGASAQLRNIMAVHRRQPPAAYALLLLLRHGNTPATKREPGSGCSAIKGRQPHQRDFGDERGLHLRPILPTCALRSQCSKPRYMWRGRLGNAFIAFADFHRLPGDTHRNRDTNLNANEIVHCA